MNAITLLLLPAIALAQVPHGGSPLSFSDDTIDPARVLSVRPTEDITQLVEEDRNAPKDAPGGQRVGVTVPINTDLSQFTTTKLAESTVYRLTISSAGAIAIGVNFDRFNLPEGVSLFVYNADRSIIRGSFTNWNNKPNGRFAITPARGDSVTVEINVPSETDEPEIIISNIAHHYKHTTMSQPLGSEVASDERVRRDFKDSESCNVNCPACGDFKEPFISAAKGVALVLTSSSTRICSGSLINNVEEDGIQYFLTALHCGAANGGADDWIFMFNYESTTCGVLNDGSTSDTVQNSKLISSNGYSDFALLEITEAIPTSYNVQLNGFDATGPTTLSDVMSISHPSGDVKKGASSYTKDVTRADYLSTTGTSHWRVQLWDWGTTEGGSSGSPLLDQMGYIRGQLHGGYAECSFPELDYYGRFAISWDHDSSKDKQLKHHLDPKNTNTLVVSEMNLNVARQRRARREQNKGSIAN